VAVNGFANDGFTSRGSVRRRFRRVVVVVVSWDVLVGRLTEHQVPSGRVEAGELCGSDTTVANHSSKMT
jgi:hypothetical protein